MAAKDFSINSTVNGAQITSVAMNILNDIMARPAIMVNLATIANATAAAVVGSVGGTSTVNVQNTGIGGALIPVPIFPTDEYKESYPCQVSTQLLVDTAGGKQFVTDNIAPGPRQWTINGYIAAPETAIANAAASLGLGSIPGANILDQIGQFMPSQFLPSLQLQKNYIVNMRDSRQPFYFRPKNNVIGATIGSLLNTVYSATGVMNGTIGYVLVGITNLEFPEYADTQNALPIQITLQEINMINASGQMITALPNGAANGGNCVAQKV